ncbi:hypothetical protein Ddye_027204 [Dipteronia dyeriana]|uniref:Uncharacterized protein n=1 Tax=Dipteronia dyeriana TaxID=168575 RepID=A0AAD9TPK7_9ROSI|nr:hypothetical protein Ddye_027204 [Dipteronia dyeriana]
MSEKEDRKFLRKQRRHEEKDRESFVRFEFDSTVLLTVYDLRCKRRRLVKDEVVRERLDRDGGNGIDAKS